MHEPALQRRADQAAGLANPLKQPVKSELPTPRFNAPGQHVDIWSERIGLPRRQLGKCRMQSLLIATRLFLHGEAMFAARGCAYDKMRYGRPQEQRFFT